MRRGLVAGVLAGALLAAPGSPSAGRPCEPPATASEFADRERFRRALEDYRETLEAGRDALEVERTARLVDRDTYRARIAEYDRAITTYREGIARYRESDCRYVDNQILMVRVDELRPPVTDKVSVRVTYYYTGNRGDGIGMAAITLLNGESTGHWAYRPAKVGVGLNVASIELGMNQSGPDRYDSTELQVGFFVPRAEVFSERTVPFERTWIRGR